MKIEVILALILGTVLGIAGMFSIVNLTKSTTQSEAQTPQPTTQTLGETTPITKVTSPEDDISWDTAVLPIRGTAKDDAFLFLLTPNLDSVIPVTKNAFEITTPAVQGWNSYSVYSKEGLAVKTTSVLSFEKLAQNKTLTQGTITDLTTESMQIRDTQGTIQQVAYAPTMVLATFIKDTKTIQSNELAIGDKIVIASESVDKGAILALGIFVVEPSYKPTEYVLLSGTLSKINKSDFVFATKEGDVTVKPTTTTKLFGMTDAGVTRKRTKLIAGDIGKQIYVTAVATESAKIARSLFISE